MIRALRYTCNMTLCAGHFVFPDVSEVPNPFDDGDVTLECKADGRWITCRIVELTIGQSQKEVTLLNCGCSYSAEVSDFLHSSVDLENESAREVWETNIESRYPDRCKHARYGL
jgi:hypothetical protein